METTISKRKESALNYKHDGYNCCQAVLLAYADKLGLDESTIVSLGAGFGMGMGTMQGSCGALVGAVIADNIINVRRKPSAARVIINEFGNKCGATICADLKGKTTGKIICSCDDCVGNAVEILEEMLGNS